MKESKLVSYKLSKEVVDLIDKIKDEYGITKTALIEKAVKFYVQEFIGKLC